MTTLLTTSRCEVDELRKGSILLFTGNSTFWGLHSMTPFKVVSVLRKKGKVSEAEFENLETGRRFGTSRETMWEYFGAERLPISIAFGPIGQGMTYIPTYPP